MRIPVVTITAISLASGVAVFGTPAFSQQQQDQPQTSQQEQQQEQQQSGAKGQEQGQQQEDALIATVGEVEVRESDVEEAISALPPQVQQTPLQMLIPAVVDQLVLRTLIVDQARAQNLQEDPEVLELVKSGSAAAEEQALVQVWVQRELDERVTDAAVEEAFAELKAANPDMKETLEEARPQIEQALQRQAVAEVSAELREGADITYYGPGGEPFEMDGESQAGGEGQQ